MKKYEFDALIQKHDSIDAAFIEFPYDVLEEFGTKGQVKVKAVFDGTQRPLRTNLIMVFSSCL